MCLLKEPQYARHYLDEVLKSGILSSGLIEGHRHELFLELLDTSHKDRRSHKDHVASEPLER